jgi:hypothetical protein
LTPGDTDEDAIPHSIDPQQAVPRHEQCGRKNVARGRSRQEIIVNLPLRFIPAEQFLRLFLT